MKRITTMCLLLGVCLAGGCQSFEVYVGMEDNQLKGGVRSIDVSEGEEVVDMGWTVGFFNMSFKVRPMVALREFGKGVNEVKNWAVAFIPLPAAGG